MISCQRKRRENDCSDIIGPDPLSGVPESRELYADSLAERVIIASQLIYTTGNIYAFT